jgi:chromosome segregation ATPase
VTPEAWGILAAFVAGMSGWVKVLLDQRGKKLEASLKDAEQRQTASLTDAGQRREEWHDEAMRLQQRMDTMDTAYKARIDAMDASHKAEVRELQAQAAKALADHYDMVKLQLNMSVRQGLLEDHIRELQTVVKRLDEHIVDLYVSIQQEPEAGPRILGRLKTARPAVLLRDMHISRGDPDAPT